MSPTTTRFPKPDFTKLGRGLGSFADPTKPPPVEKSLFPTGPAELYLGQKVLTTEGPGQPPVGFVGGTTSIYEWYIYWALLKLSRNMTEFQFSYQESFVGGRHIPGGAVIDFVVYLARITVLIRVVTWRFHHALGAEKVEADREQKIELTQPDQGQYVIDIYDIDFMDDESGQKAIEVVQDALNLIERPNPFSQGIARDI